MWCLVSQPNAVLLEVRLDPKAIGQECLEKVCEHLNIGPEADYFGLKISRYSPNLDTIDSNATTVSDGEEEASEEWANLRNPMAAQRPRLRLRVKFWVPPHRLLLPATKHQFYLNARRDLLNGKMVVAEWDVASRLVALVAQAEYGDCDPEDPPTCVYKECHNIGPQNEKPIDYIQHVIDYHCQITGMKSSTAEYQLLKEISELESFGEELFFCKPSRPHNQNDAHSLYTHLLYHGKDNEAPNKYSSMYASQDVGCLTTGSAYDGVVEGCGCKMGMAVGVGPRGLVIYRPGNNIGEDADEKQKQSILYTAIIRAAPVRRTFQLTYLKDDGRKEQLDIKMYSSRVASALYRSVTEKHAFYCCETVGSNVTKQFIRDLKGTIVSIFNEDSTLGKKYVFDIRRTYTEVYDNARRALFAAGNTPGNHNTCAGINCHRRGSQCGADCKETRERSNSMSQQQDNLPCRVCMDQQMDTLFLPCRHVLCCVECANRCTTCPLCRAEIESSLRIYLPVG